MERANTLTIISADDISMSNPRGSMGGFSWTGEGLYHKPSRTTMRFNAEITAAIAREVALSHPAEYERRSGGQIQDGDREGWHFIGVIGDAVGMYERQTREGYTGTVQFGKQDLI